MVGPQLERSTDQESGEATWNRAAGRSGIAIGHPLAARDQQPAARQQVELIAADLGPKREQEGERETDDEHGDDTEIGAVALGSPAVSRHGPQDSSACYGEGSDQGVEMRRIRALAVGLALTVAASPAARAEGGTPAVGDPAPQFSLPDEAGKTVKLDDYKGKYVVLYFYPKDFTSGCTIEARNFQRDLAKYEDAGAAILGVSVDTSDSHKDFCAKEGLNFKLLSDQTGATSQAYGSVMEYNGNKLSARNTFIIDGEGKVAKVFTGVKPPTHSEEVLAALGELKKPAGK